MTSVLDEPIAGQCALLAPSFTAEELADAIARSVTVRHSQAGSEMPAIIGAALAASVS